MITKGFSSLLAGLTASAPIQNFLEMQNMKIHRRSNVIHPPKSDNDQQCVWNE